MQEPSENDLADLQAELHKSHGTPPTHVEAASVVAEELEKLDQHPTMQQSSAVVPSFEEYMAQMESAPRPEPSSEFELPLRQVDLVQSGGAELRGVQALAKREIVIPNSQPQQAYVIGAVTFGSTSEYYQVLQTQDGNVGVVRIDAKGDAVRPELADQTRHVSYKTLRGALLVSQSGGAQPGLDIRYSHHGGGEVAEPKLFVSEQTDLQEINKVTAEHKRVSTMERQKRLVRAALAGVVLWATITPGGLVDGVMDPFAESKQTVIDAMEMVPYLNTTDLEAGQSSVDNAEAALIQTMEDLDNHQYEAVIERAEAYKQSHEDYFMSESDKSQVLQALEGASNSEEVVSALAPLSDFYNYTFIISDNASVEAVKYSAGQIAQAIMRLPSNLMLQANVRVVHLQAPEEIKTSHHTDGAAAFYTASERAIYMPVVLQIEEVGKDLISTAPGSASGYNIQEIFLHELGHGFDAGEGATIGVADSERVDNTGFVTTARDIWLGGILSSPEVVSTYARTDSGESLAESISGVLSSRNDGLAHPDEVRKYQSGANRAMLANLATFEAFDPGLADYLVSINPRLMRGNTS